MKVNKDMKQLEQLKSIDELTIIKLLLSKKKIEI